MFLLYIAIYIPENWLLQCVSPEGVHAVAQQEEERNSISGVEIESPYKAVQREKEEDSEIPGIGQISSRWVGGKGKQELIQLAERENCKTEVQGLKLQLHTLADECKKALVVLGAEASSDLQVQKATSLCDAYITTASKRKLPSFNEKMGVLWKSRCDELPGDIAGSAAATVILGPQLVHTIMEKDKQPPDVSCSPLLHHTPFRCLMVMPNAVYTEASD